MKNKFLNLNWRRISVLFAVVVVVCSAMVCAVPCSASSVELPDGDFGILFPSYIPDNLYDGVAVLPLRFTCDGSYLQETEFVGILLDVNNPGTFSYQLPDLTYRVVYENSEWINDAYRYIFVTQIGDSGWAPSVVFNMLISIGSLIEYGGAFSFDAQIDFIGIQPSISTVSQPLYAVVDGRDVYRIHVDTYAHTITFNLSPANASSEYLVAYSNGQWINESFRNVRFVLPFVPESYEMALLFANNEAPPPSFLDRVTYGLTAVIGWVGAVASAVIFGSLSPLLGLVAVGIAVSSILLVIYLVRRFIWGA